MTSPLWQKNCMRFWPVVKSSSNVSEDEPSKCMAVDLQMKLGEPTTGVHDEMPLKDESSVRVVVGKLPIERSISSFSLSRMELRSLFLIFPPTRFDPSSP